MAKKYKNKVVEQLATLFVDKLEEEARAFIDKTISEVTYQHQSGNLYDSYGYGIYLDGKLLRSSARDATQTATEPIKWYREEFYGYELMRKVFANDGYKPSVQKGYVVVFVAAAPYTNVLQYGLIHGLRKDYHVISFMETEAWKFGSSIRPHLVSDVREGNYQAWNNGVFVPSKFAQG